MTLVLVLALSVLSCQHPCLYLYFVIFETVFSYISMHCANRYILQVCSKLINIRHQTTVLEAAESCSRTRKDVQLHQRAALSPALRLTGALVNRRRYVGLNVSVGITDVITQTAV